MSVRAICAEHQRPHHPGVDVVQDVTMKHPHARPIVISNDEAELPIHGHVRRVSPLEGMYWLSMLVQDLKEEAVHMKGMSEGDRVLDRPHLPFVKTRLEGVGVPVSGCAVVDVQEQ